MSDIIINPQDYLEIKFPDIKPIYDNVINVFVKNIPAEAAEFFMRESGEKNPSKKNEVERRKFLQTFIKETIDKIARYEYCRWLNGRLPFITPKELLLWRLRQYVQYIWAYDLPDDEDIALIFNTTKTRASFLASDFTARFRKSLLFPVAIRRLYRILLQQDPNYKLIQENYAFRKAEGKIFRVPSRRYVQYSNTLIEEFRLREVGVLRDAALISAEENFVWLSDRIIEIVQDVKIRNELFTLYEIEKESGND